MDFLLYIFLFFIICLFVVLGTILYNIILRSYKPQNAVFFVVIILVVFCIVSALALNSANALVSALRNQQNQTNQPQNSPGSNFNF